MPLRWAWGQSWRTGRWPRAALAETRPQCRAGQCPAGPAQSVSTTHPPPRTRARLGRLPVGVAGPQLRPPDQDRRACVPGWPSSSSAAGEPPRPGWELPAAVLAHEIQMSRRGAECSDCGHGGRGLQSVKRPGRGPSQEPAVSAAPSHPRPTPSGSRTQNGAGWAEGPTAPNQGSRSPGLSGKEPGAPVGGIILPGARRARPQAPTSSRASVTPRPQRASPGDLSQAQAEEDGGRGYPG